MSPGIVHHARDFERKVDLNRIPDIELVFSISFPNLLKRDVLQISLSLSFSLLKFTSLRLHCRRNFNTIVFAVRIDSVLLFPSTSEKKQKFNTTLSSRIDVYRAILCLKRIT